MTPLALIVAITAAPAITLASLSIPPDSPAGAISSPARSIPAQPDAQHPPSTRSVKTTRRAPETRPIPPAPSTSTRSAPETSALRKASSLVIAPDPSRAWVWPLSPVPRVARGFHVGPSPWSPGHRGVDLETEPGAVVRAPAAGVIRFSGVLAGRPVLAIDHGGGLISSFEPAIGRLPVGAAMGQGDAVATIASGPNHCAPRTCLHWGVRRNGRYIDPLTLVPGKRGPAVLLPLPS